MTDPANILSIRIVARKDRTIVGEAILIDLHQEVHVDLDMETVELNNDRTRIQLTRIGSGPDEEPETQSLSGSDHLILHRTARLKPLGKGFRAPVGSSWSSLVELALFTRPLIAGKYQIQVTYRYGVDESETVKTNTIEFVVIPAQILTNEYRWFGGSYQRMELASIWTAQSERGIHWTYQVAGTHNPGAVKIAVVLNVPDTATNSAPVLAHLNDFRAMHYTRYVVWPVSDVVAWVSVHIRGRQNEPSKAPHGLAVVPTPRILDPPLQLRSGGLSVLLAGKDHRGAPALSHVLIDENGSSKYTLTSLSREVGTQGVVIWSKSETPVSWTVYHETISDDLTEDAVVRIESGIPGGRQVFSDRGRIVRLVADQWLGKGAIMALFNQESKTSIWGFETESSEGKVLDTYKVGPDAPGAQHAADVMPVDSALGLAILLRAESGLFARLPGEWGSVIDSEIQIRDPVRVVATPRKGIFAVYYVDESQALNVAEVEGLPAKKP